MSFFDALGEMAKSFNDKVGDTNESTRLSGKIKSEKAAAAEDFKKIGEYYYNLFASGAAVSDGALELCRSAKAHLDAADGAQAELDRINEQANAARLSAQSAAQQSAQPTSGGFEGAFANLQRSMESFATQASQNMKTCPSCGESTTAEKKFCPSCGAKLPEFTVAQGAVCTSCGKQNKIGTKFCQECGAKLPAAIQEEQAAASKDSAVLAQWEAVLPQYPKWNCGGRDFSMTEDGGYVCFGVSFSSRISANAAIDSYRQLAKQNGFVTAGQYPSEEYLHKMINGSCYRIDTGHCYEGSDTNPEIYFYIKEPEGGFYYKKPEERPKERPTNNFFDLFKY